MKMSVDEIKKILSECTYEQFMKQKEILKDDDRKSIKNLILKYENKFEMLKEKNEEYNYRKRYETELYEKNFKYIAGVDEVGRGPLAGPVYAAAVILNPKIDIIEIKDSKKLSHSQRTKISERIKNNCIDFSIGYATVEEIDNINILNATKLAMKRAIEGLKIKPDYLLIDALKLDDVLIPQMPIIKGDDLSVSIGAASIIAKVERDSYMDKMSKIYPQYNFDKNKGYGTKDHIDSIKKFGICEIHRKGFVKNFI
ncbi:RNase HII [Caloramator quimbayensis]|uniref:Ribonuclease HII n=1 Tax=Caloramator quimbayensis TaxID=1147123 RepID=A0A1T4XST2_9CLOT|nr:ribonuclease HII [Caloramator quimbayensis]SKA92145.1 RNase HII [Caloramator quimbayensis]